MLKMQFIPIQQSDNYLDSKSVVNLSNQDKDKLI